MEKSLCQQTMWCASKPTIASFEVLEKEYSQFTASVDKYSQCGRQRWHQVSTHKLQNVARSSCGTMEKVLESWDSDSSESLGMSET